VQRPAAAATAVDWSAVGQKEFTRRGVVSAGEAQRRPILSSRA